MCDVEQREQSLVMDAANRLMFTPPWRVYCTLVVVRRERVEGVASMDGGFRRTLGITVPVARLNLDEKLRTGR